MRGGKSRIVMAQKLSIRYSINIDNIGCARTTGAARDASNALECHHLSRDPWRFYGDKQDINILL